LDPVIEESLFDPGRMAGLRRYLIGSTQALLGETIVLTDAEWQSPSGLPGWTRAHVASHLSQQAGRLTTLAERLLGSQRGLTWAISEPDRGLEEGSRRHAVDLQVALDTSSGKLLETLDRLTTADWQATLATPIGPLPARALPLARLNEVVLHHADLRLGRAPGDTDPEVAGLLLQWNVLRLSPRLHRVQLRLLSDEGLDLTVGAGPDTAEVRGSAPSLLGWITGRLGPEAVLGAERIEPVGPL
jgi:maleylpyruvate isomerase